jgi:hypothetical protein
MNSIGMENQEASNLMYQIKDNIQEPSLKRNKLKGGKRKKKYSKKNKKTRNKRKSRKYNK